jgi:hypothetical protein
MSHKKAHLLSTKLCFKGYHVWMNMGKYMQFLRMDTQFNFEVAYYTILNCLEIMQRYKLSHQV